MIEAGTYTVWQLYRFYIRGKNPKNEDVVNYINSTVDAEFRDYAWMIAKHESRDQYTGTYYNQFNPSDHLTELPFKSGGSSYYGWGIAQIDNGQSGSVTAEVYDWHRNVVSLNAKLQSKASDASRFLGYYREAYSALPNWSEPPPINVNGVVIPAMEWSVLTLYNGARGIPGQTTPTHSDVFLSPLQFNPQTGEWIFHHNTLNPNYVRDVISESNP